MTGYAELKLHGETLRSLQHYGDGRYLQHAVGEIEHVIANQTFGLKSLPDLLTDSE